MGKSSGTWTLESPDAISRCKIPAYRSVRWHIAVLVFFAYLFTYLFRVNFSVALICMVRPENETGLIIDENVTTPRGETDGSLVECDDDTGGEVIEQRGEFDWDKSLQSKLLAAFFYGYILTQVAGGWLSRRFGTRIVMGIGLLVCAICTILLPVCARAHVYLAFATRVIIGMSTGVVFPAAYCLWGRWSPPFESTRLSAFAFTGTSIGSISAMTLSGVLCAYGFDNGWASIFYIFGGSAVLWAFGWFYVVRDTPSKHPRITDEERLYIETAIGESYKTDREHRTPWLEIFKSPAVWAGIVAHFCNNWTTYTLITGLPTYIKEVLRFDIRQNGALSALPYVCDALSGLIVGRVADFVRERGTLNTQNTRRLFQTISFLGMAVFMVATGFITCERRALAVVFLCLAVSFQAFGRAGFLVNHIDYGPRFAGELFGITNTFSTIPGMVAPIVNGALTPNKSQEEWQKVFYMCAGFAVFGAIFFFVFVRGEPQPWNNLSTSLTIDKDKTKTKKPNSNIKSSVQVAPESAGSEKGIVHSVMVNDAQIASSQTVDHLTQAEFGQQLQQDQRREYAERLGNSGPKGATSKTSSNSIPLYALDNDGVIKE